ncbi:hypothetical protein MTO96_044465 [Rhipicephalus appendiculatus]
MATSHKASCTGRWTPELGYHDVQKCLQRNYAASDANAASSMPGGVRLRTEKTTQFDVLESLSLLPAFKLFLKHVNKVNIEGLRLADRPEHHCQAALLHPVHQGAVRDDRRGQAPGTGRGSRCFGHRQTGPTGL